MKHAHVIILAGGYATRLYPLTLNRPKPLLHVADKPILEHLLNDLDQETEIEQVHIVGNEKFALHFEEWLQNYKPRRALNITFINDGSTDESNKLGAIGDLHLVLEKQKINDDTFVIAGDNLFGESLQNFFAHSLKKQSPVVGVHDLGSPEKTAAFGMISLNESDEVKEFIEKPKNPTSSLIGVALYYYPKAMLPLVKKYLAEGNNPDQPGRLIEWLYRKIPVYAWRTSDAWFDIGSKETLEKADLFFTKRQKHKSR